jgi:hypothetical protein
LLKIGDNSDCCCVQGLALGPDGEWLSGALKHGYLQHGYSPKVSPLYTATLYEGELSEEEQILKEISDIIGGSEEKGRAVCEKMHILSFRGEIDEESLRMLI